MVNFNALAPGQTVWRRITTKQGGTQLRGMAAVPVTILQIDQHARRCQAQWGSNPPRWYGEASLRDWSRHQPRGLPEAILRKTLK